ncbi:hypothetical protein FACS1894189_1480 [Planctomycetales bacterium]|nr:hypothetical protein FACS1894189_1480 [Planctomycetales bacterium]
MPDGIDLYVNACLNRGTNHTLLRSFFVEFELTRHIPHKSPQDIEKLAREIAAEQRQLLGDNHPRIKQLTDIPAIIASLNMQFSKPSVDRFQVMYRADDVSRRLLSVTIDEKTVEQTWERKSEFIENYLGKKNINSAVHFSQMQEIVIETTHTNPEDFINMGRLRGDLLAVVEVFLMTGTNLSKHEFAQANIDKFRQEAEKQKASGLADPLIVAGLVEYDSSKSRAYVVESKKKGKVAERFWIDASLGYVCPLVQYFDDNGSLVQEYKASNYFLDERSGLWFPVLYTEFVAAQKGEQEVRREYRIDPKKLRANFPVADEEFCIDVQENTVISDVRKGQNTRFKAFEKGALSLAKNGLDLDNKDWLARTGESAVRVTPNPSRYVIPVILASIGTILIVFGLYRLWKQKHLLILLCLLPLVNGCGKGHVSENAQNAIVIAPAVLDFGQARYADSPIKIPFTDPS